MYSNALDESMELYLGGRYTWPYKIERWALLRQEMYAPARGACGARWLIPKGNLLRRDTSVSTQHLLKKMLCLHCCLGEKAKQSRELPACWAIGWSGGSWPFSLVGSSRGRLGTLTTYPTCWTSTRDEWGQWSLTFLFFGGTASL